ncbi:MAG: HAD hydrolase family protein [Acholeplasma sp.]|nr:HAD hydrolase family protein [Acholeplasma sp.]
MKKIKYIFLDVDGTLTDGKIIIDNLGNESKSFSVKDGQGIKDLQKFGVEFIIVTGRTSNIVSSRSLELGIKNVHQGIENKEEIIKMYSFNDQNQFATLYIGDDINDLPAMLQCDYIACPKDSVIEVIHQANYISKKDGGNGAVRDILDHYMKGGFIYNENFK